MQRFTSTVNALPAFPVVALSTKAKTCCPCASETQCASSPGFAVFRFDYTNPLSRPKPVRSYWTISLGPTF